MLKSSAVCHAFICIFRSAAWKITTWPPPKWSPWWSGIPAEKHLISPEPVETCWAGTAFPTNITWFGTSWTWRLWTRTKERTISMLSSWAAPSLVFKLLLLNQAVVSRHGTMGTCDSLILPFAFHERGHLYSIGLRSALVPGVFFLICLRLSAKSLTHFQWLRPTDLSSDWHLFVPPLFLLNLFVKKWMFAITEFSMNVTIPSTDQRWIHNSPAECLVFNL